MITKELITNNFFSFYLKHFLLRITLRNITIKWDTLYNLQWKQVSNIKKKLIQKKFKRETKNIYIEKSEEYKEKNYNHDSYNEFDSNVSNCTWLHWPCLQCGLALGHSPEDRGLLKQTIIDWCGICEINKEINLLFFLFWILHLFFLFFFWNM